MEKKTQFWIIFPFCLFIGAFSLASLLLPDKNFSPRENRYLQPRPDFSFSALFDGSYTRDYEKYCSDQFALRDLWIELKAALELGQGKRENNGVFLCEGERLIEPFTAPGENELIRRAALVETLSENLRVPVTLALIPSSAEIYGGLLPSGAANDSQRSVIGTVYDAIDVKCADILSALRNHSAEDVFYRTDHHWTSLGAYYAYAALGDTLGYTPVSLDSLFPQIVSESFCGTAYSSSGFFWVSPDRIETLVTASEALGVDRFESQVPVSASLYCEEMLDTKDQYRFFLGGNAPRVVIRTGRENAPSLLLIRDSFSDSLAPFLLSHFGEIHLLDLRYYRDSVSDYVKEHGIDQVCVIYSVTDFCTDANLALMTR